MHRAYRPAGFILCILCTAIALQISAGCTSREHFKAEADEEVYNIIDSKWHASFGGKSNYVISDVAPLPNDIQLEKAVPPSRLITLAEAVAMATAQNRNYQTQKEGLYETALDLTLTRHKYVRQWFGTVDSGYLREGQTETASMGSDLGTTQTTLLPGGAWLTTELAISWTRFLLGDPRTSLGSVLSATLEVPLLGIGAGRIAQEELTQSERNVLYEIRSFNRFRKDFVVSIVNDYYNVLRQRDTVTNAENNYKRVGESKERLEMEAKAGRKPPFEVDQAEQNLLKARDGYVVAQQNYEQAIDKFKIRLALPTDANVELDQNELKALEEIGIGEVDYTLDVAIESALLRRLDLANEADKIDDELRDVVLAADGLGPQLNLTGGVGVESREGTDVGQLQFHEGEYSGWLEADLPFDRKAERNAYRKTLIDLEQQQRRHENKIDTVKLEVRQAYRRLAETAERYSIQKNSLALAEKRVESTTLLLEAGRAKTRDLLDSQDDLLDAQNSVTGALVAHLVAKLTFFKDVGVLQVRPDGMWE